MITESSSTNTTKPPARLAGDVAHTTDVLAADGVSAEDVIAEVAAFSVAAPSWAVGTGGTRFGRFPIGGEPRDTTEKVDDVAALNALTGANRHDQPPRAVGQPRRPGRSARLRRGRGIAFDAMNSNTFQDNPSTTEDGTVSYKFGSLGNVDDGARKAAIEHNLAVIDMGVQLGSTALTVWLADGMNHPGQASFRGQLDGRPGAARNPRPVAG